MDLTGALDGDRYVAIEFYLANPVITVRQVLERRSSKGSTTSLLSFWLPLSECNPSCNLLRD
jgi:hypothetical protein